MTRFPNPFASALEIVAKAFAIVGARDGAGTRDGFGIGLPHTRARRRMGDRAPQTHAPSTRDVRSESPANATETSGSSRPGRRST
jgi:hypothetical protein